MSKIDVYPVGLLWDLRHDLSTPDNNWRNIRRGFRVHVLRNIKRGRWHELRSYFNGYLAECVDMDGSTHWHNCGRGWTTAAALREVNRLCEQSNR